jgi:prophage antirepressor-like protein
MSDQILDVRPMDATKTTTTALATVPAFAFEGHDVRVELFDGEPWWSARDVAMALGYAESSIASNMTNLVSKVPDKWKGIKRFITLGGVQEIIALSEQGLYFFVARSDKPAAFPFQEWIAGEVIPSIRKTGAYAVELSPCEMLLASAQRLVDQERRVAALEREQAAVRAAQQATEREVIQLAQHVADRAAEGRAMILALPAPTVAAREVSTRARINQLVQGHIFAHGSDPADAAMAWRRLYREFKAGYGIDLAQRAKNQGRKVSGLDIAEALDAGARPGTMADLYAVAVGLFGAPAAPRA